MKHHLIATLILAAQLAAGSAAAPALASSQGDPVVDTSQFQLRAPINSAPQDVRTSNPGSDNYRSTAPFPTSREKGVLGKDSQPPGQSRLESTTSLPQARLTSIIGANAQLQIEEQDIALGPLRGLIVEVHNGTDRPLLFDGDKAVATIGGAKLESAPVAAVDNAACPVKSSSKRLIHATKSTIVAAATLGAGPSIRDAKVQRKPVPERYGCDEARRVDELSRFGKRILWPGDTTTGVLYFKTDTALKGAALELPVRSLFDTSDQASITKTR